MTPPVIAQAIVAISAPPNDYESVLGDLHEEYVRRAKFEGPARANAWYWAQAVTSVPYLLSYSRTYGSFGAAAVTSLIVFLSIVALLCTNELIGDAIHTVYRSVSGIGAWPYFVAGWIDAACFGALIAALRRSHGMRVVLHSAIALLAFIAVPIALQISSPLTAGAWLLVVGGALSMTIGGAAYHLIRMRSIPTHI